METIPHHAKYFAHDLTRRGSTGLDRLSMSLFDSGAWWFRTVNGMDNLENLRLPDATWKVRLIEEDFHRLMFAGDAV